MSYKKSHPFHPDQDGSDMSISDVSEELLYKQTFPLI